MISGIGPGISSITSQLDKLGPAKSSETTTGFGDVFKAAVGQVDTLQAGADQKVSGMLSGTGASGDVSSVMVSVEKADVAFQLMMQVRNKIVNAYQDIEKMQF